MNLPIKLTDIAESKGIRTGAGWRAAAGDVWEKLQGEGLAAQLVRGSGAAFAGGIIEAGPGVDHSTPHVPELARLCDYKLDQTSVALTPQTLQRFDCAVVVSAHEVFDYAMIREHSSLIVDTRNVFLAAAAKEAEIFKA